MLSGHLPGRFVMLSIHFGAEAAEVSQQCRCDRGRRKMELAEKAPVKPRDSDHLRMHLLATAWFCTQKHGLECLDGCRGGPLRPPGIAARGAPPQGSRNTLKAPRPDLVHAVHGSFPDSAGDISECPHQWPRTMRGHTVVSMLLRGIGVLPLLPPAFVTHLWTCLWALSRCCFTVSASACFTGTQRWLKP
ncbi:hypothetical protein BS50DRAFT_271973 [Corynespora cassiicola Philippines]|uniref:Uncharacterized protein n=1 Tax=Corynespora cassiicola Philippines TaxID=1448308 RepID=A0A2T2P050_CORCC|nr:hypothetical protein BS50DRAFT_271973 [Corynespora cassiicola Philippines]